MKNRSVFYLLCILLGSYTSANGQTVTKCFRADWLQGERVVEFTLKGNKASGTFIVRGDTIANTGIYNFSGTLDGNTLTVAFAGNHLPDVSPSEMKSLVWKLSKRGGKESLRIKFSGKNYQTNKYEESFADFESCAVASNNPAPSDAGSGYAALTKSARTVRFARGASSASFRLDSLARPGEANATATFLLNAARSQRLEIQADGCRIEVYLPNRKLYEYVEWEGAGEKTYASSQMDRMTIKALPATGNYLIVLHKLTEDSRPETLTVTVTK
jgi:hypothetical protein